MLVVHGHYGLQGYENMDSIAGLAVGLGLVPSRVRLGVPVWLYRQDV